METGKMGKDAANGIQVTFFVAECMEFLRYGEYVEGIASAKEALEYYEKIPGDRLNAGKGIGVHVHDPKEADFMPEFQLLTGKRMDIDILQMMYGFEKYPQVLEAARELIALKPEITVIDGQRLLAEPEVTIGAVEMAEKINEFQRKLDPDFYSHFYPDDAAHVKKIAMQILADRGKKEYLSWLSSGNFGQFPEIREEAAEIHNLLENAQIQWPETLSPFVYIDFSEDAGLEGGDVLPIEEADPLFRSMDQKQVMANKEQGGMGYCKTKFQVWYQMDGERSSYEGRQDFGDGDGSLLDHIESFQRYYLETEDGARELEYMGKEWAQRMIESSEYIRDTLLPFLKYYCNLYEIEKALKEEQENNKKVPVITDRQEARMEYHRDMLRFIEESRRALSQGGELPPMPDIKDYEETKEKKSYREHVMKEIEEEAKGYNMTVEEYAKNGYELKENPGIGMKKRR